MTDRLSDETTHAQPIPRFGEAEEVARMTRFLLCEATFSTGTEFVIDGGAVTGQAAEADALAVVDDPERRTVIGLLTEQYALHRYSEELDRARRAVAGD